MVTNVKDRTQRPLWMAVIDEVDSILIDESRTPLIISGGKKKTANLYIQADQFVKRLKSPAYEEDSRTKEKKLISGGYEIDEKTRQIMLSEDGVKAAERFFRVKNLYDVEHTQLVHHIIQALRANYIMKNEVEYVVSEDQEIVIVDQFTGRLMKGREYSGRTASGDRGKRRCADQRGEQHAGNDHIPELLPSLYKTFRYDRYGKDRRRGIPVHLQYACH